jgi:hypothetical protein
MEPRFVVGDSYVISGRKRRILTFGYPLHRLSGREGKIVVCLESYTPPYASVRVRLYDDSIHEFGVNKDCLFPLKTETKDPVKKKKTYVSPFSGKTV